MWLSVADLYSRLEDTDNQNAAFDSAIAVYEDALAAGDMEDEDKARTYAILCTVALSKDDVEAAGEYLEQGQAINADNADVICANADYLYATTGSYLDAANYLYTSLEKFDQSSEEYNRVYNQYYNYYIYYYIYGQ